MPHPTLHQLPRHSAVPRAGRDPVGSLAHFLALVGSVIAVPLRSEMFGVLLDHTGRGHSVVVVDDVPAGQPRAVLHLAEVLAEAGASVTHLTGLLLASVRPHATGEAVLGPGDADTWCELDHLVGSFGLALLEWAVVSPAGVGLPRELAGEPPRW